MTTFVSNDDQQRNHAFVRDPRLSAAPSQPSGWKLSPLAFRTLEDIVSSRLVGEIRGPENL